MYGPDRALFPVSRGTIKKNIVLEKIRYIKKRKKKRKYVYKYTHK